MNIRTSDSGWRMLSSLLDPDWSDLHRPEPRPASRLVHRLLRRRPGVLGSQDGEPPGDSSHRPLAADQWGETRFLFVAIFRQRVQYTSIVWIFESIFVWISPPTHALLRTVSKWDQFCLWKLGLEIWLVAAIGQFAACQKCCRGKSWTSADL